MRGRAAAGAFEEEQQGFTQGIGRGEVSQSPNGLSWTSASDQAGDELQDLEPAAEYRDRPQRARGAGFGERIGACQVVAEGREIGL